MKTLLFIPIFLLYLTPLFSENYQKNIEESSSLNNDQNSSESFLSFIEYGRFLYHNPRGISCAKCHGKKGEGGKKIAKYYDKHQNIKILKSIDIRSFSLSDLTASLSNQYRKNGKRKYHKIMPIYYFTDEEIKAIFAYLTQAQEE